MFTALVYINSINLQLLLQKKIYSIKFLQEETQTLLVLCFWSIKGMFLVVAKVDIIVL